MSRRISLAASVIISIGCIATISTDASAYFRRGVGVGRVGVYRGGVYRGAAVRRGVAVGVGAAAFGAAAVGAAAALPRPVLITRQAITVLPRRWLVDTATIFIPLQPLRTHAITTASLKQYDTPLHSCWSRNAVSPCEPVL